MTTTLEPGELTPEAIRLASIARRPCPSADRPGICVGCLRRLIAEKPTTLVVYCWDRHVVAVPQAEFGDFRLQILDQESFDRLKVRAMQ